MRPSAATSTAPERVGLDHERLFHEAPCGYVVTDDEGRITSVNETFLAWTGHRADQLEGTKFADLLPVGDRMLFTAHCVPQLRLSGAISEVAVDVVAADRTRRPAFVTGSRSAEEDGPVQVRLIVFGAKERRAYEAELVAARRRAEESEARRASAEADLQHRVLHDPLTALPNRTGLMEHLAAALLGAEALTVLYIDLDHFKAVNDSLGHAAGDEFLSLVAQRLRSALRESATIARLAGDEFAVAIPGLDPPALGPIADRLLAALAEPVTLAGLEIVPSASIGAAVSQPGESPDELLRRADHAMYDAKSSGRHRWRLHDESVPDAAAHRLRLLGEMRAGLEQGEFRLHYQPQVELATGALVGVEALIRWEHPSRGLLSPFAFVDAAEESGLIRQLGAWVIDEAAGQAARWRDLRGTSAIRVAVNVSARQLVDSNLLAVVTDALDRHELLPGLLQLEITETALMEDPASALASLEALAALGVHLAIDDFGTGYSSLAYLKRFPVHELKVDRAFVEHLEVDEEDRAIVASCIQLSHAVGVSCLAEGVETDSQRRVLVDLGCDRAQGYHFARPLPASSIEELLRGDLPWERREIRPTGD